MGVSVRSPQVHVNFFTEKGNFAASSLLPDNRESDQLLFVETAKDLREPAGRFTVHLSAQTFESTPLIRTPATQAEQDAAAKEGASNLGTLGFKSRRVGWKDILQPGDLVVIEMGPDRPQPSDTFYAANYTRGLSGTTEIVMVGSIDDIQVSTSVGNDGKPSRVVVVSGRDFGKYLVDDQIWRDPWWDFNDSILRFRTGLFTFPEGAASGMPANIIKQIFSLWIFRFFNVEFNITNRGTVQNPADRTLKDILRYAMDAATPEVPFLSSWIDFEGSPWALFQSIQGPPWYTLQLDTRRRQDINALLSYTVGATVDSRAPVVWNTDLSHWDHQVCLLYHRNPASNRYYDDWTTLPTRVITPDDVIDESLGVSLEEVFSRWRVLPTAPGLDSVKVAVSFEKQQDLELERRFGFRPRILQAPFFRDQKDPIFIQRCEVLTKQLRDWDVLNIYLLSGSFKIKGMASARVGDRLFYQIPDQTGLDFYIESVTQQFQAFQGWTTTLQVTRGQTHREKGQALFDTNGGIIFPDFNGMGQVAR